MQTGNKMPKVYVQHLLQQHSVTCPDYATIFAVTSRMIYAQENK